MCAHKHMPTGCLDPTLRDVAVHCLSPRPQVHLGQLVQVPLSGFHGNGVTTDPYLHFNWKHWQKFKKVALEDIRGERE